MSSTINRTKLCQSTFLAALTIDALGSGLFLPFAILFFVQVRGLSIAATGSLVGISGIIALAALPLCGALLDKIGPRIFSVLNFAARGLAFSVYLITSNLLALGAAFAVVAIGDRSWPPASQLYIAGLVDSSKRAVWVGLSRSFRMSGMAIGSLVAGALATFAGAFGLVIIVAANSVTFFVSAAMLTFIKTTPSSGPKKVESFFEQIRCRKFQQIFVALAPSTPIYVAILSVLPIFIVQKMGAPQWTASAVLFINTLVTILAQVPMLTITKGIGNEKAISLGSSAIGIGYLTLSAAPAFNNIRTIVILVILGTLIASLGADLFYPSSAAYISNVAPEGSQGKWLTAYQMEFAAANGIGVAALTALADFAPALLWPVLAVITAVGCLLQRLILSDSKRVDIAS